MTTSPSVGRIVHYVSRGSADGAFPAVCRAAVVTEVGDSDALSLAVLNPSGLFFDQGIPYEDSETGRQPLGGTWHWPERV